MKITRGLIAACTVFAAIQVARAETNNEQRPNFIVLLADDVSWNDIGAFGHPTIRTPHLDQLAEQGMRFDHAFLTCSSCSPSRASLLTGRYPHQTGAAELHQPLPADQVTVAGRLKEAGYFTAAAGKWHLGAAARKDFHAILAGGESGCEKWEEALAQCPDDRPFFLWLASIDAHRDYRPETFERSYSPLDAVVPAYLPNVPEVRLDLAHYYNEITRLDDYVGRLLAELERRELRRNTVVLFLADNGRPFPRCKTTLYDSGIRTPLIVSWPGHVPAGTLCQQLVSSIDLAPTVLDLAGVPVPDAMIGQSLRGPLSDPEQQTRTAVFAEHNWHDYQAHERAVRTQRYLYIRNAFPELPGTPPADAVRSPTFAAMQTLHAAGQLPERQQGCFEIPRPAEELYDLASDPDCLTNLAEDPDLQEVRRTLAAQLEQWIQETGDQVPSKPTPDRFDRTTGNPK